MMKKRFILPFLQGIAALLGAFLLFFSFLPMANNRLNVGMMIGILLGLALVAFAFFYSSLEKLFQKIRQTKLWVPFLTFLLICAVGLAFFAGSVACVVSGIYDREETCGTVIVLGCLVEGEEPSPLLRARINRAADYLSRHPESVCVASGGMGDGESITEAACIKRELIRLGIEDNRIFEENRSTNTRQNIAFSKEIIERESLSQKVAVVTNDFHVFRGRLLARQADLDACGIAAYCGISSRVCYVLREACGLLYYLFFE